MAGLRIGDIDAVEQHQYLIKTASAHRQIGLYALLAALTQVQAGKGVEHFVEMLCGEMGCLQVPYGIHGSLMGGKAQGRSCRNPDTVQIKCQGRVFGIGGLQTKGEQACQQYCQQAGTAVFFQGKITKSGAQFSDGNRLVQGIEYRIGFVDKAPESQDLMLIGTCFHFLYPRKIGDKDR